MDAEHLKRILVVDDEADVTELLDYKFRQAGYAVRALNDPLRAIGLARDFRPDLIILDVMMPELTGVQLLRMVRADALLQDTPVIFLTAKAETADKVKGLESGADDYVAKPFDVRELMLRAQALLRRAKSAAAKPSTRLAAGALLLDIERHEVTAQGKPVELTATEFKLLRLLLELGEQEQSAVPTTARDGGLQGLKPLAGLFRITIVGHVHADTLGRRRRQIMLIACHIRRCLRHTMLHYSLTEVVHAFGRHRPTHSRGTST